VKKRGWKTGWYRATRATKGVGRNWEFWLKESFLLGRKEGGTKGAGNGQVQEAGEKKDWGDVGKD